MNERPINPKEDEAQEQAKRDDYSEWLTGGGADNGEEAPEFPMEEGLDYDLDDDDWERR